MSYEDVYTVSNASMDTYPKNSRSQYSNMLPKVIKPIKENADGLYLSLESLILEKTFVQFNSDSNTPDIFWYNPLNSHSRKFFLVIQHLTRLSLCLLYYEMK